MRLYHPDRNHGGIVLPADYAAESTKRLNEIYNVLKDHRRKFKYDQLYGLHDGRELKGLRSLLNLVGRLQFSVVA